MEWRDIDSHLGLYEVSDTGLIRRSGGALIGQWCDSAGYMIVRLSKPRRTYSVHRLVAKAFLPNPSNYPNVNHLDHDRSRNSVENLEWCTQKQNLDHARAAGRMTDDYWTGKRSPSAKLTDEQAAKIRKVYSLGIYSQRGIAQIMGCSKRTVQRIVSGQSYKPLENCNG